MARTWLTPQSACVVNASGCVNGSEGAYVWFVLAAGVTSGACAVFFRSNEADGGRKLLHLTTAACTATPMYGPFLTASGVYVTLAGTGACATVAANKILT